MKSAAPHAALRAAGAALLALATACSTTTQPPPPPPSPSGTLPPSTPIVLDQTISIEPWSYAGAEGSVIRTAHYRIFTTAHAPSLRDRAPGFLEHALAHYRSALGPLPLPAARLDTYILRTRSQWNTLTKQLMSGQADSLLRIPRGGYASRGIGVYYDIGLFDTLAIAAHEGWHQYTQRTFREGLPVWLEEGIASFMEGHRWDGPTPRFLPWANIQRFDALRAAVARSGAGDASVLTLARLLEARPSDFLDSVDESVLTYYAQLWALVHFLNEGAGGRYASALRSLLADTATGRVTQTVAERLGPGAARRLATRLGPGVFLAYFNHDFEAAQVEYRDFLTQMVRTGAREAMTLGRSPISDPR